MEFQNTIGYGTFNANGGDPSLTDDTWVSFPFAFRSQLEKNTTKPTGATTSSVQVKATGMYFIEFSFIADGGDSKNYNIRPYVNGAVYTTNGTGMQIRFYQQPLTQKYEASTHGLFALTKDDIIEWKIYVTTESSTDFFTRDIVMNIINLQQIGLH